MNQVEAHPLLPQDDLVAYCKEQNIHITAYSPLGNNSWGRENLTASPGGETEYAMSYFRDSSSSCS